MKGEGGEVVELFAADLTGELLESRVCVHVIVEVATGLEGCVADFTHKWPVERVGSGCVT